METDKLINNPILILFFTLLKLLFTSDYSVGFSVKHFQDVN